MHVFEITINWISKPDLPDAGIIFSSEANLVARLVIVAVSQFLMVSKIA